MTTRGTTGQHGWATGHTPMARTTTAPTPHTERPASPSEPSRRWRQGRRRGTDTPACQASVPPPVLPRRRIPRTGSRRPARSECETRPHGSRDTDGSWPTDLAVRSHGAALPLGAAQADERASHGVRYVTDAPAPGKRSLSQGGRESFAATQEPTVARLPHIQLRRQRALPLLIVRRRNQRELLLRNPRRQNQRLHLRRPIR